MWVAMTVPFTSVWPLLGWLRRQKHKRLLCVLKHLIVSFRWLLSLTTVQCGLRIDCQRVGNRELCVLSICSVKEKEMRTLQICLQHLPYQNGILSSFCFNEVVLRREIRAVAGAGATSHPSKLPLVTYLSVVGDQWTKILGMGQCLECVRRGSTDDACP